MPVLKATNKELEGRFDWVMMHHSFEHVADPRALLASVQGMLTGDGRVLIRMLATGGWAWRNYGVNWVQVDAPRHLVLYTIDGFRRIAEECGFLLDDVFYDSGTFQFWGSELVARHTRSVWKSAHWRYRRSLHLTADGHLDYGRRAAEPRT